MLAAVTTLGLTAADDLKQRLQQVVLLILTVSSKIQYMAIDHYKEEIVSLILEITSSKLR